MCTWERKQLNNQTMENILSSKHWIWNHIFKGLTKTLVQILHYFLYGRRHLPDNMTDATASHHISMKSDQSKIFLHLVRRRSLLIMMLQSHFVQYWCAFTSVEHWDPLFIECWKKIWSLKCLLPLFLDKVDCMVVIVSGIRRADFSSVMEQDTL